MSGPSVFKTDTINFWSWEVKSGLNFSPHALSMPKTKRAHTRIPWRKVLKVLHDFLSEWIDPMTYPSKIYTSWFKRFMVAPRRCRTAHRWPGRRGRTPHLRPCATRIYAPTSAAARRRCREVVFMALFGIPFLMIATNTMQWRTFIAESLHYLMFWTFQRLFAITL